MYFIGVTTAKSSINAVFPRWAERLGLGDVQLVGLDFPLHDRPENYRAAIDFIRRDPQSLGALVTSHKVDLCAACQDQFDELDPLTRSLGEVASIFKRAGRLHGRAVDPITSGLALRAFLPEDQWLAGAEALILGAGGSGTALAWHLNQPAARGTAASAGPNRVHVADRDAGRLEHLRALHAGWPKARPLTLHRVSDASEADRLVTRLPAGSLVVNATGMGKDVPGSPLTDAVVFPERAVVWEFNYRGDLLFLEQARAQQAARALRVEDGWRYFLHGWTRVIADVFDREIPSRGPGFDELSRIAATTR